MRFVTGFLVLGLAAGLTLAQTSPTAPVPVILVPEIVNVYPHDGSAFTQGLLYHAGKLYESTGKRGASSLREVEITTGEVLRQVDVTRPESELTGASPLPDYFAEGLTLVDNQLIQLTWTEGEAFVYDLDTFERTATLAYEGEGWGICYDGSQLYMSDSTAHLDLRVPDTFANLVSFAVVYAARDQGSDTARMIVMPSGLLNELECVDDSIYANLWQTDLIAQIDKHDGTVQAFIDASSLLTDEERLAAQQRDPGATLNGIAYNPDSDTFYLTGKNWDKLFEVRFVPAPVNE